MLARWGRVWAGRWAGSDRLAWARHCPNALAPDGPVALPLVCGTDVRARMCQQDFAKGQGKANWTPGWRPRPSSIWLQGSLPWTSPGGPPPGSHVSRGPKNILCVYMSVLLLSWEGGPTRLLTGFSERSVHPDQPVPFLCPAAPNTPLIEGMICVTCPSPNIQVTVEFRREASREDPPRKTLRFLRVWTQETEGGPHLCYFPIPAPYFQGPVPCLRLRPSPGKWLQD